MASADPEQRPRKGQQLYYWRTACVTQISNHAGYGFNARLRKQVPASLEAAMAQLTADGLVLQQHAKQRPG
jgi:hypothetical protein